LDGWRAQERQREACGGKHDQRADKEHRAKSRFGGNKPKEWRANAKSEVETSRIRCHGEASALRRRASDGLHPEAWINQSIAKTSKRGTDGRRDGGRGKPDER
jgi:hypothetical protein